MRRLGEIMKFGAVGAFYAGVTIIVVAALMAAIVGPLIAAIELFKLFGLPMPDNNVAVIPLAVLFYGIEIGAIYGAFKR